MQGPVPDMLKLNKDFLLFNLQDSLALPSQQHFQGVCLSRSFSAETLRHTQRQPLAMRCLFTSFIRSKFSGADLGRWKLGERPRQGAHLPWMGVKGLAKCGDEL